MRAASCDPRSSTDLSSNQPTNQQSVVVGSWPRPTREPKSVSRPTTNEPPNKQTNKQTKKQKNKQANKQTNKQSKPTLSTRFVITWSDGLRIRLGKRVCWGKGTLPPSGNIRSVLKHATRVSSWGSICFTICLFISPDLDGYRAPRGILTLQDPQGLDSRFKGKARQRCEPTFRASKTPALLRSCSCNKERSCGVSGRLRSGSGTYASQNDHVTSLLIISRTLF